MSDKQQILIELHNLLEQQIETLEKGLNPEGIVEFNQRLQRIRDLAEQLRDEYIDSE